MVGPFGDSVKYSYASPPLLHTEVDGVRILSRESVELLQVSDHADEHADGHADEHADGHL